jgi:hypothetical protein
MIRADAPRGSQARFPSVLLFKALTTRMLMKLCINIESI